MFFALCRTIFSPSILGEPFGRVFTLGPPVRQIGQCARVISGWPSDPLHVGRRVGRQFFFPSTSPLFDLRAYFDADGQPCHLMASRPVAKKGPGPSGLFKTNAPAQDVQHDAQEFLLLLLDSWRVQDRG